MERRHAVEVERDRGKIDALAPQQRRDALERTLDGGRRRRFARLRKAPDETRARVAFVRLGKLHGEDAAPAPRDAATADRRVEQRKSMDNHAAILAPAARAALGESCSRGCGTAVPPPGPYGITG